MDLLHSAQDDSMVCTPAAEAKRETDVAVTSYYLNKQGRITDVSGSWDKSAWTLEAFEATADFVIGQQLAEFVDGFATASFLNALFFASRRGNAPFQMMMRSDSDCLLRILRMEIKPVSNDLLRVSHQILMERSFEELGAKGNDRPTVEGCRCSMCCNQRMGQSWVNPLADRQRRYIATSYEICPDCKIRARNALERVQGPVNVIAGFAEPKTTYGAIG